MTITHFSNGQIFDGETPDLKTDCYVEVSDNKITYIGKEKPESRCDQAFDLKGSTIMGNGQWAMGNGQWAMGNRGRVRYVKY